MFSCTEFYQQQRPLLPASLLPAKKEKLLGQLWKTLSDADRAKYKIERVPRANAYTLFCNTQRPLLPPGLRNPEREQLLGQMWRALVKPDQRPAPSGDNRWAVCQGATSAPPSYTPAPAAALAPAPTMAPAPVRVPAWQAAEWANMDGPWNSSGARVAAYSATCSAAPEFIQRSAKAAEAAYNAYFYSATGGSSMHAGCVPMPLPLLPVLFPLMSVPVRLEPPAPFRVTIVAPPIKRPAPPALSAPKTLDPCTHAELRAALLALGQPCAPQKQASVTLAAKKRPRECPLDDVPVEDERVAVWNRVTGKKLTGQVALTIENSPLRPLSPSPHHLHLAPTSPPCHPPHPHTPYLDPHPHPTLALTASTSTHRRHPCGATLGGTCRSTLSWQCSMVSSRCLAAGRRAAIESSTAARGRGATQRTSRSYLIAK